MVMDLRIKTFLLGSLLLSIPLCSGMLEGTVDGFREGMNPHYSLSLYKGGIQLNTRKLLLNMLDYDDTGPNPKHDPRKKPGHP